VDGSFVEISFFGRSKEDASKIFIAGHVYQSVSSLFDDPVDSQVVHVYKCKRLTDEIQFFRLNNETKLEKIYRTPLFGKTDTFVCSVLLHTKA